MFTPAGYPKGLYFSHTSGSRITRQPHAMRTFSEEKLTNIKGGPEMKDHKVPRANIVDGEVYLSRPRLVNRTPGGNVTDSHFSKFCHFKFAHL